MSKLVNHLPWLMAGAALYHLGQLLRNQRQERLLALVTRHKAATQARARRLYVLATACQRGTLGHN